MERFGPQNDWQSFCRGMVTNGMYPEKDIVMGRAPEHFLKVFFKNTVHVAYDNWNL